MKAQNRINKFIKKEGFKPEAYEICPKFEKCDFNKCPLHKDYSKLEIKPEDKRGRKCKCSKSIRKQIGTYFGLKNKGLKERELSGLKRWENLSESEKQAKKEKLRKISLFHRLSKKGYGISRVSKKDTQFTLSNEIKTPQNSNIKHISKENGKNQSPGAGAFDLDEINKKKIFPECEENEK